MKLHGLKNLSIFIGLPLIFSPLLLFSKEYKFSWVYIIYALFIIFEPIPLGATALIPLIFLPIFAITPAAEVATSYFFDAIPFVIACFMLALAVEETELHRRIAVTTLHYAKAKKRNILIAISLSTAFISMFITDVPVLIVVISIIFEIAKTLANIQRDSTMLSSTSSTGADKTNSEIPLALLDLSDIRFCKGMLFCALVACIIGGRITLTGTVMNFLVKDIIKLFYPDLRYISYMQWFCMSLPAIPLLFLAQYVIVITIYLGPKELICWKRETAELPESEMEKRRGLMEVIEKQYKGLGRISFGEVSVMVLLFLCVLAWFFRNPGFMPGWNDLLPANGSYITDTTFTLLVALLFFIWPKDPINDEKWTPILTWEITKKFPWGFVLLIGSSFAITQGMKDSKFVDIMTCSMVRAFAGSAHPIYLQVLAMCITLIDAGGANMIWSPIFLGIAQKISVHPFYFVLPIILTACAQFVLPNSLMVLLLLQTKIIGVKDLIIPGLLMELCFVAVTVLQFNTWAYHFLDLAEVPVSHGVQFNCTE